MRTRCWMLCCAVFTMFAGSAQATGQAPAGQESVSSVQVSAAARARRFLDQDLDELRGRYALSNGWRLRVEPGYNAIWARIDRQRPMRLAAVSEDIFASHDNAVVMIFDRERGEMVLRYLPQQGLASVVEAKAVLVGR